MVNLFGGRIVGLLDFLNGPWLRLLAMIIYTQSNYNKKKFCWRFLTFVLN